MSRRFPLELARAATELAQDAKKLEQAEEPVGEQGGGAQVDQQATTDEATTDQAATATATTPLTAKPAAMPADREAGLSAFESWRWLEEARAARGGDDADVGGALLPLCDILNHRMEQPITWETSATELGFRLPAHAAAPGLVPGSEVFNNYGARGNGELLLAHGFAFRWVQQQAMRRELQEPVHA